MVNIALCLTGFLRNIDFIENIKNFYNKHLLHNQSLTIYYSCPSKIEETDHNFDKDFILKLFKNQENDNIKVNISFRDYDKNTFVLKAQQLNLPHITSHNYHSHRIISCLNGFAETAKLVNNSNYNFIIFSRLDIINNIASISEIFDNTYYLKNVAYVWRTIPYISSGNSEYHVEDRFFISSNECIDIIKNAYTKLDILNIKQEHFLTELVLGKIFNLYETISKYHLHGLKVTDDFDRYMHQRHYTKYAQLFLESM
jgi:hypothetical protein